MTQEEMQNLARQAVETALAGGADTAETSVVESTEFEVTVRKGDIETLTESVSSRIAITLSVDRRKASATSSDLSADSIKGLIAEAVELAGVMDSDEFFGLPEADELGRAEGDLLMFDEETVSVPTDEKIRIAHELEDTLCKLDERIISDGASFSSGILSIAFANSLGFSDGYDRTFNSTVVSCAAEDKPAKGENTGKKQSSWWYSNSYSFHGLDPVEEVASKAVSRTLDKLGAVKPRTCEVPVVFDTITAREFLASIAAAAGGGNIYKKASFLVDRKGVAVGSPLVSIIDDPLLPGKPGTRPFDSEGVRSRSNVIVEKGILESYLLNSYQARKLKSATTGSAGGSSNFYMIPGSSTPEEIIGSIDEGLYLTSLSGPGANWTTGDFSQGGQGIWIEKGILSYPVNEFTIAGTFEQMLKGIIMIGSDLEWRSSIASPTFKIKRMTISGT